MKVSVSQVVSMNVPEGVLLHARVLVPINVHLHVLGHVWLLVKRCVGLLVMVVVWDYAITLVNLFQNENEKVTDFNSVITQLLEL